MTFHFLFARNWFLKGQTYVIISVNAQRLGAQPRGPASSKRHFTLKQRKAFKQFFAAPCHVGCSAWLGCLISFYLLFFSILSRNMLQNRIISSLGIASASGISINLKLLVPRNSIDKSFGLANT